MFANALLIQLFYLSNRLQSVLLCSSIFHHLTCEAAGQADARANDEQMSYDIDERGKTVAQRCMVVGRASFGLAQLATREMATAGYWNVGPGCWQACWTHR